MPYLSNTEADFEVSRPAGATHCSNGGEIVNWLQKKLRPEIEIIVYSSSRKLLE